MGPDGRTEPVCPSPPRRARVVLAEGSRETVAPPRRAWDLTTGAGSGGDETLPRNGAGGTDAEPDVTDAARRGAWEGAGSTVLTGQHARDRHERIETDGSGGGRRVLAAT